MAYRPTFTSKPQCWWLRHIKVMRRGVRKRMIIYIMMHVCLSRKMITSSWESPVTTWTPHNHPVQLPVIFDGSRLVFHGSMSVFMVVVVTVIIKSVIISTCDYNNDWVFKDTLQVPVVEPYAGWAMLTTQVKWKQKNKKKTKKRKKKQNFLNMLKLMLVIECLLKNSFFCHFIK